MIVTLTQQTCPGSKTGHTLTVARVVGIIGMCEPLPKWRNGRRGGLKNRWELYPV